MTVALRPSIRLLALVPVLVAFGAVVLDVALHDFFGVALLPILSLLVYVGVGLLLTIRLPHQRSALDDVANSRERLATDRER
jgi:hypothetical protein